jgi:hypothetical protein
MATNTYTYGSLGQRWTVGETTSKTRLDISRNSADANRWTLQQLITDPDNTANFVHGIKAIYTSAESTATDEHVFIHYKGLSEQPKIQLSTLVGSTVTINGLFASNSGGNTYLWNNRRSTGLWLGANDKLLYYISSAYKEVAHEANAIITTGMIDATTLVTSGETFVDNDTTIPTSASVKAYADSVGGGISFSGSTADGLVTFGSSSSAVVESTATYASDILTLSGNPYWALTISGTNDGKIKLSGSNSPQIAFVEGSTDRALLKWNHTDNAIGLENAETNYRLRVGTDIEYSANNGTSWTSLTSGGGGISWDGSTANGVAIFKDADEATVSSTLTYANNNLAIDTRHAFASTIQAYSTDRISMVYGTETASYRPSWIVANLYHEGSSASDWHCIESTSSRGYGAIRFQSGTIDLYSGTPSNSAGDAVSIVGTTTISDSSGGLIMWASGNALKAGGTTWGNSSDERLKNVGDNYTTGLADIIQIQPKKYTLNGKGGLRGAVGTEYVGVIAQEVISAGVFDDCITTRKGKLEETDEEETDIYVWESSNLIYAFVNAFKEVSTELDTIKERLTALENA